jgi:hypothetical protein
MSSPQKERIRHPQKKIILFGNFSGEALEIVLF